MLAWLVLKFLPVFAFVGNIAGVTRWGIYGMAAVFCIFGAVRAVGTGRKPNFDDRSFNLGVAAAALFLLSFLPHSFETIQDSQMTQTLPTVRGIFLFVTLTLLVRKKGLPQYMLWAFFVVLTVIQVGGLVLSAAGITEGYMTARRNIDEQRIVGFYNNAWTVLYGSVAYCGIALMMVSLVTNAALRAVLVVLALIGASSAILSVSRTALVIVPVVLAGAMIEVLRRRGSSGGWKSKTLVLTGIGLGLLCGISLFAVVWSEFGSYYIDLYSMRLEHGVYFGDNTRWSTMVAGLNILIAHPLSGVGWDLVAGQAVNYGSEYNMSVHNLVLDAGAQGGLAGVVFGLLIQFGIPIVFIRGGSTIAGVWTLAGTLSALAICQTLVSTFMLDAHWDVFCYWVLHRATVLQRGEQKGSGCKGMRANQGSGVALATVQQRAI